MYFNDRPSQTAPDNFLTLLAPSAMAFSSSGFPAGENGGPPARRLGHKV